MVFTETLGLSGPGLPGLPSPLLYVSDTLSVTLNGVDAVSYTHLDVYKRQVYTVTVQINDSITTTNVTLYIDPNQGFSYIGDSASVQSNISGTLTYSCLLYTSRCV